jgi:hypothetical protein
MYERKNIQILNLHNEKSHDRLNISRVSSNHKKCVPVRLFLVWLWIWRIRISVTVSIQRISSHDVKIWSISYRHRRSRISHCVRISRPERWNVNIVSRWASRWAHEVSIPVRHSHPQDQMLRVLPLLWRAIEIDVFSQWSSEVSCVQNLPLRKRCVRSSRIVGHEIAVRWASVCERIWEISSRSLLSNELETRIPDRRNRFLPFTSPLSHWLKYSSFYTQQSSHIINSYCK